MDERGDDSDERTRLEGGTCHRTAAGGATPPPAEARTTAADADADDEAPEGLRAFLQASPSLCVLLTLGPRCLGYLETSEEAKHVWGSVLTGGESALKIVLRDALERHDAELARLEDAMTNIVEKDEDWMTDSEQLQRYGRLGAQRKSTRLYRERCAAAASDMN